MTHFDVTMTKRQNIHVSETEKVYCVIMTSFSTKRLEILHKDFHKIVFAHTKFGLVQMKRSGIKGGRSPPPRPERVFDIPAWIGLRFPALSQVYLSLTFQLSQTVVVKVGNEFYFPDRSGQVKQFTAITFY